MRDISCRSGLLVELVPEDLAGLELEHLALREDDRILGPRVDPLALVLVLHDEVAETGNLDVLAAGQGVLDEVDQLVDKLGGLLLADPADAVVDELDDIGLRHPDLLDR
jgi:hypothetical protein